MPETPVVLTLEGPRVLPAQASGVWTRAIPWPIRARRVLVWALPGIVWESVDFEARVVFAELEGHPRSGELPMPLEAAFMDGRSTLRVRLRNPTGEAVEVETVELVGLTL